MVRARVRDIVTVRIGKKGITDALLREIDRVLESRGIVKVKMLRNFREATGADRFEVAKKVAEALNARLVEVRGFTFILKRSRGRGRGL